MHRSILKRALCLQFVSTKIYGLIGLAKGNPLKSLFYSFFFFNGLTAQIEPWPSLISSFILHGCLTCFHFLLAVWVVRPRPFWYTKVWHPLDVTRPSKPRQLYVVRESNVLYTDCIVVVLNFPDSILVYRSIYSAQHSSLETVQPLRRFNVHASHQQQTTGRIRALNN